MLTGSFHADLIMLHVDWFCILCDLLIFLFFSFPFIESMLNVAGKMYPGQGDLHIAPFTDEALYMEQYSKANFWSVALTWLVNALCLWQFVVDVF